ncbi:MAG: GNAT family N-acetyltransferase [Thermoplasmatota archaeon]
MRIGIIYNLVEGSEKGTIKDGIADNDILNTLKVVMESLSKDHQPIPIRISRELIGRLRRGSVDFVFNLCEGFGGRSAGEAWVASYLELMEVPFTGSGPFTLFLCLDKARAKQILKANRISTPRYQVFHATSQKLDPDLGFPVIVKPLHEDASVGISQSSVVDNKSDLFRAIDRVIETYDQPAIVEEFIDGREVNVAIMGNHPDLRVLPLSEIIFDLPPGVRKIVDFDAKWTEGSTTFIGTGTKCPADIDKEMKLKIESVAKEAYRVCGCRDYGRVDIRIRDGKPYVLEVNPNPGIGPDSGFFRSCSAAGMDYSKMVRSLLDTALKRHSHQGYVFEQRREFSKKSGSLTFREVQPGDLNLLVDWMNDPEIASNMDDPHNPVSHGDLVLRMLLDTRDLDLLVMDESDNPIGFCSVYDISGWNSTCEISYLIGEKRKRGRGYGSMMVDGLISICREDLKAKRIIARSLVNNPGSLKILKSAGFHRVGRLSGSHVSAKGAEDEFLFELGIEGN